MHEGTKQPPKSPPPVKRKFSLHPIVTVLLVVTVILAIVQLGTRPRNRPPIDTAEKKAAWKTLNFVFEGEKVNVIRWRQSGSFSQTLVSGLLQKKSSKGKTTTHKFEMVLKDGKPFSLILDGTDARLLR